MPEDFIFECVKRICVLEITVQRIPARWPRRWETHFVEVNCCFRYNRNRVPSVLVAACSDEEQMSQRERRFITDDSAKLGDLHSFLFYRIMLLLLFFLMTVQTVAHNNKASNMNSSPKMYCQSYRLPPSQYCKTCLVLNSGELTNSFS